MDSKSNLKNPSKFIKNSKIVSHVNKSVENHTTYIYYFHKKNGERGREGGRERERERNEEEKKKEMRIMSSNFMEKHV
jgi:hypothetical protein